MCSECVCVCYNSIHLLYKQQMKEKELWRRESSFCQNLADKCGKSAAQSVLKLQ